MFCGSSARLWPGASRAMSRGQTEVFPPACRFARGDCALAIGVGALAFSCPACRLAGVRARGALLTRIALLILRAISRLFALLILWAALFILLHFCFCSLVLFFVMRHDMVLLLNSVVATRAFPGKEASAASLFILPAEANDRCECANKSAESSRSEPVGLTGPAPAGVCRPAVSPYHAELTRSALPFVSDGSQKAGGPGESARGWSYPHRPS